MANDGIRELGEALHAARREDRVGMRNLAAALGVSYMTLYRIERGEQTTTRVLLPLVAALDEAVRVGDYIVVAWRAEE